MAGVVLPGGGYNAADDAIRLGAKAIKNPWNRFQHLTKGAFKSRKEAAAAYRAAKDAASQPNRIAKALNAVQTFLGSTTPGQFSLGLMSGISGGAQAPTAPNAFIVGYNIGVIINSQLK